MHSKNYLHFQLWVCLVCLGFCIAVAIPAFAVPAADWRLSQEDTIRVSALKFHVQQIQQRAAEDKKKTPSEIFLGQFTPERKYVDLSDQVMQAFVELAYVKKFSQSHPGQNNCPTDKETGERGSLLYVGQFHWENDKVVDLDGGSDVGFPGSRSWSWHLVFEDGTWVVKTETLSGMG